ncbi:MAG: Zn-dependent M16 (insulinase) family peptidase [Oceanicoccus sp.]
MQAVKQLDDSLQTDAGLQHYVEQLSGLHDLMLQAPKQLLLIAEADKMSQCQQSLAQLWQQAEHSSSHQTFQPTAIRQRNRQLWIANSPVNFCAKAYPTVPSDHSDAPALTVLGGFLRNGFLHRAIREQGGAYGGGAGQDSNIAAFRFYSYRDPRLVDTLADFDAALDWLHSNTHNEEQLEQAILGVISSLDKPGSPAGEAKQSFHSALFGRSHQQRQQFRQAILAVTLADLQRVANSYLQPEKASIAVVSNATTAEQVADFIGQQAMTVHNM